MFILVIMHCEIIERYLLLSFACRSRPRESVPRDGSNPDIFFSNVPQKCEKKNNEKFNRTHVCKNKVYLTVFMLDVSNDNSVCVKH